MKEKDETRPAVVTLKAVNKNYRLLNTKLSKVKALLVGETNSGVYSALKNIDLEIKKGEVLGVLGKNGAGKSTLLKIISGLMRPSSGDVFVQGEVNALIELHSGLNMEFTGLENIHFLASISGIEKDKLVQFKKDVIEFSELGEFLNQPVKKYSSGMKARLGFAINTSLNPEILILDEVLSVGDVFFQRKAHIRMRKMLEDDQVTVIYVSHDTQSISRLCTRAILLNEGELVFSGAPATAVGLYEAISNCRKTDIEDLILQYQRKHELGQSIETLASESLFCNRLNSLVEVQDPRIEDVIIKVKHSGKEVEDLQFGWPCEVEKQIIVNEEMTVTFGITLRNKENHIITGFCNHDGRVAAPFKLKPGGNIIRFKFFNLLNNGHYFFTTSTLDEAGNILYRCQDIHGIRTSGYLSRERGAVGLIELINP